MVIYKIERNAKKAILNDNDFETSRSFNEICPETPGHNETIPVMIGADIRGQRQRINMTYQQNSIKKDGIYSLKRNPSGGITIYRMGKIQNSDEKSLRKYAGKTFK